MRLRMMSPRGKERNGHGRWQKMRNWFPPDRKWEHWCRFSEQLEMCPGKVARPPQWLHGLSARLGSKTSGLWQKFSRPRIARNWKAALFQGTSLRKGEYLQPFHNQLEIKHPALPQVLLKSPEIPMEPRKWEGWDACQSVRLALPLSCWDADIGRLKSI